MRITKSFTKADIDNHKIIIYGAGRYGELALRGLEALGAVPCAFADRSAAGGVIIGLAFG